MTSRIATPLVAALLLGLAGGASGSTTAIDLFSTPGVPGTGGHATVVGPCYCDQGADFSPVLLLAPGTYDFGLVRDYWIRYGAPPEGGPNQPNLYLLFSPWEAAGTYPGDLSPPPSNAYPSAVQCAQDDAACNASYEGAYLDTRLIFTVAPGQDAIQIGFIGPYAYTSPLPEPFAYAMLLAGLILLTGARRGDGT